MKAVKKSISKIDGMGLVTGQPVYTDDLAPKDALIVKMLRSPHPYAKIKNIDVSKALLVPGVECILTHKDLPRIPFTRSGASFPEPASYDTFILDEYVRFVGDDVAIVAAVDEETAEKAMKMIKVDYEVLEPVLDYEKAIDHKSVVHADTKDYHPCGFIHPDFERNITCEFEYDWGKDWDEVIKECDVVIEQRTYSQAQEHAMMETYRTYTYKDMHGRLVIVSSTQVPYHVRRTVARSLGLSADQVRVIKPRIGGGFGGKQSLATEFYPAAVTMKTGKPAKIIYTREETTLCTTTRHRMRLDTTIGAMKDGTIRAVNMEVLSDQGAYGEHSKTTLAPAGYKTIPLYNKADVYKFHGYTVYTNNPTAGAFRGFGVTQGILALESAVNKLAHELGMDPAELRNKNMLKEGETSVGFNLSTVGADLENLQTAESCGLHEAVARGKELIGWDEKYPQNGKEVSPGKFRGVGMALSMQGSGIPNVDSASATIKFQEQGFFTLLLGAADIGTGSDTILKQIAADAIGVSEDRIRVFSADTDVTPFDVGAYASSTTYVSGNATKEAGELAREALLEQAARILEISKEDVNFDGDVFKNKNGEQEITIEDLGNKLTYGRTQHQIEVTGSYVPYKAASPYMSCFVEVEVDAETGMVEVPNLVGVVDCGTPINPKLCRVQTEGGMIQGLGLALMEKIGIDSNGKTTASLMEYKIPARDDMRTNVMVDFTNTYEPTGPYGAKSIGEVVLNPVPPAIQDAIYNAVGVWLTEMPMTPESILKALKEKKEKEANN